MFVGDIARRQTFFFCCHIPSFPPPFEAPQIGLGKWLQHDKLFPTALFHPLLSSPLFHLSFDLGLGDILHYLQCVKITFKRKWNTSTTPLRLNSPWFHHMHPHVCYSEKSFFRGMADGTLPHSHSHSNMAPPSRSIRHLFIILTSGRLRGRSVNLGFLAAHFRPFLGWKEAIFPPKWHLPFPPPARNNISMWNDCGILHS